MSDCGGPRGHDHRETRGEVKRINLRRQLELLEVRYLEAALLATDGNKRAAAKLLTISRTTLYRRLELLGVSRKPTREGEPCQ